MIIKSVFVSVCLCFVAAGTNGGGSVRFEKVASGSCSDSVGVFKQLKNVGLLGCTFLAASANKSAFNFVRETEAQGQCQIMELLVEASALVPTSLCDHYNVVLSSQPQHIAKENQNTSSDADGSDVFENFCKPNPCLNGGTCRINETSKSSECLCPKSTSGETCQEIREPAKALPAKSKCGGNDQLIICIFYHDHYAFIGAISLCSEYGMRLHMPKTEAIWNFTQSLLSTLVPEGVDTNWDFWFGLNRTSADVNWTFLDGTPLGSFQPWKDKDFVSDDCGVIRLEAKSGSWDSASCDSKSNYVVCE